MRRLILFLAFSAIAFAQPQVLPQCTGNSSKNCTPKVNSSGAYVPPAGSVSFTQLSGDAISGVSGGATTINFVSVTTLPSAASAVIGRPYRMTAATTANICPTAGDSAGSSLAYCVSNGTTYASLIVAPGSTGNVALPGTLSVGTTVLEGASGANGNDITLGANSSLGLSTGISYQRAISGASLFFDAVHDENTFTSTTTGGYASFDSMSSINAGAVNLNHANSFQSRFTYNGTGLMGSMVGLTIAETVNGPLSNLYGMQISPMRPEAAR